jgi:hypothetical protein
MESKTFEKRDRPTGFTRFKERYNKLRNSVYQHQLFFIFKKPKDSIIHFNASFKPETLTKTQLHSTIVYRVAKSWCFTKNDCKKRPSDVTLFPKSNSIATKITRILLAIPALIGF